jgi:inosine-uridine nucleoside N-ribohydrolase
MLEIGNSGLDCSTSFPLLEKCAIPRKAVIHIYDAITSAPHPVTLVATGCLTNYALLFTLYPEVKQKIEEVVILGGAMV